MEEIISQDIFELDHESPNFSINTDRFGKDINIISNFKDFKTINLMLHDMTRIQDNDDGMRKCKFRFDKAMKRFFLIRNGKPRVTTATEHINGNECIITKRYSLFCLDGELMLSILGREKSERNRIDTVDFKIDKVDPELRNKVMGWFE